MDAAEQDREATRRAGSGAAHPGPTAALPGAPPGAGDPGGAGARRLGGAPERVALEGLEARWSQRWEEDGIYRFDRGARKESVYSIDTPPPTVSGSLHIGHVFSYTQTDVMARFMRMRGREVFYPIGWDDNGLPTERRVQNYYGVRCDPSVAYDPAFEPPDDVPSGHPLAISRPNFIELCERLTAEDEQVFEQLFRLIALSVDWRLAYTTISPAARRVSQLGFLHLLRRGDAYRHDAPTMWDVDFRSAVAQAELEDREQPGAYHRIAFPRLGGEGSVEIETTRPELLPACVALVAHPDDDRYAALVGSRVTTPLFSVPVPVLAHPRAEPDKGTGIAMVCTFGDLTDVMWWRELALPTRGVVGRDGRFGPAPFGSPGWESLDPQAARHHYGELEGKTVRQAQRRIVEMLAASGDLIGEPRPITHAVKFYEKGERPLEIVTSPQWYVRTLRMRQRLLEAGRRVEFHPAFMRVRYEDWVEGLTGDWNISRQRFFGVPFPVWYPLDEDGEPDETRPILADESALPVDPSTDAPPGYDESRRGKPGGFAGDPDVMDTWATSSLSPQIAAGWPDDAELFGKVFPMDVRPQAHEIIRTWLFSTMVRSISEHGTPPWHHAALSGWILDPDRKKMSKSKGNVVAPFDLIHKHSADAVRYWAASARLGVDTAFDEQQMAVGRRLALKVLNATKFVLAVTAGEQGTLLDEPRGPAPATAGSPLAPVDSALLERLGLLVDEATAAFEDYEHARALERTESLFWYVCDDYLELVKMRAYAEGAEGAGARRALRLAMSVLLRLLAPVLAFSTEEAWSWWHDGSIHRARWPERGEIEAVLEGSTRAGGEQAERLLEVVGFVLSEVRGAKTGAKRSLKSPVARAVVSGPGADVELARLAADDLAAAGSIAELAFVAGDGQLAVSVTLDMPAAD